MRPSSCAGEIARALAARAENVCRHYLPAGHREGRYWMVGDVRGAPGRSLFVRLTGPGSGPGAAGKWTDAATGEHGDLLDIVRLSRGHGRLSDAMDEARRFLAMPLPVIPFTECPQDRFYARGKVSDRREAANRLWRAAEPVAGTIGARYLAQRGITSLPSSHALRYLPRCWTRRARDNSPEAWPALIAAIRDADGALQAVQRTWIDAGTSGKAPLPHPRKTLGPSFGHAVWFGWPADTLLAGEGLETVLSLRQLWPWMPMAAATSAAHLAGLMLPAGLRQLWIARDNDPTGISAAQKLAASAEAHGARVRVLTPRGKDFNDDLRRGGPAGLAGTIGRLPRSA